MPQSEAVQRTASTMQRDRQQDLAELQKSLSSGCLSKVQALTRTFEAFDLNGDGVIDRREFVSTLQKVDASFFTVDVIDKLLAEADTNDDGEIHYTEFITWLCGEDEMILER